MTKEYIVKGFEEHPVSSYILGLQSDNSKRGMLSALKSVFALALKQEPEDTDPLVVFQFNWIEMSPAKMKAMRAALLEKYPPISAAKMFSALKGVLNCVLDDEELVSDPKTFLRLQRAARVKGVKSNSDHKTGRCLTDGEALALARVCGEDESPAGARDDALIGLGLTQGPRINEIASFMLSDYDPETGNLVIKSGKGGKSRVIRASNATKGSLDEWLIFRGSAPGALFCQVDKSGEVITEAYQYEIKKGDREGEIVTVKPGLSTTAIGKILRHRAAQAGVKTFTMHDLRRSYATVAWRIGISGPQIQYIMGHASMATTAAYDRGDQELALQSSDRIHYPSQRNLDG